MEGLANNGNLKMYFIILVKNKRVKPSFSLDFFKKGDKIWHSSYWQAINRK